MRDLKARGLLDETLVIFGSEFGRTPFAQSAGDVVGPGRDHNQYGFSIGGPVFLPKLYNGKNKTFFFADYEALRRTTRTLTYLNIPTMDQRKGILCKPVRNPITGETIMIKAKPASKKVRVRALKNLNEMVG